MQLTGPQLKQINRILAHAFPSYAELQRMVRFSLGVQLNTIVQSSNVTQAVFELVDWADTHGKMTELIQGAQEENADHVDLRTFAVAVRVLEAPTLPAPTTSAPRYHTLVVDPLHRGDYPTISEAIAAAKPGDRIVVHPGTYNEGLIIDKPLEIVGEGQRADIVVQASGADVILFQASAGRVQNLTLWQTGGGNWFGVDITQGRLELEDCDIRSASLACAAIHNGADPRLRRNRIHDGKVGGVSIYDDGQGLLEDNDITANSLYGVGIRSGGNPTLRGNGIHQHSHAIWISQGGAGTFQNNDLRDNVLGAWDIAADCLPNVKRSGNIE